MSACSCVSARACVYVCVRVGVSNRFPLRSDHYIAVSFLGYPAVLVLVGTGRRVVVHFAQGSRQRSALPTHVIVAGVAADVTAVALLSSFFADSWVAGLTCVLVAVYGHAFAAAAGVWVRNGYFMPPSLARYFRTGVAAATATFCVLAGLAYVNGDGGMFLIWLGLGCLPTVCAVIGLGVSESRAQRGVQSVCSEALFPVYVYDAASGLMKEANSSAAAVLVGLTIVHVWGAVVSCLIAPAAFGVIAMCLSHAVAVITVREWIMRSDVAFHGVMVSLAAVGARSGRAALPTLVVASAIGRAWAGAEMTAETDAARDEFAKALDSTAMGGAALVAAVRSALGGLAAPKPSLAAARSAFAAVARDVWFLLRGDGDRVPAAYDAPARALTARSRSPLLDPADVAAACAERPLRLTVALVDMATAADGVDAAADAAARTLAGVAHGVAARAAAILDAERSEWDLFLGWLALPQNADRVGASVGGTEGLAAKLSSHPTVEAAAAWPLRARMTVSRLRALFESDREALAAAERERAREAGASVHACASGWECLCARGCM